MSLPSMLPLAATPDAAWRPHAHAERQALVPPGTGDRLVIVQSHADSGGARAAPPRLLVRLAASLADRLGVTGALGRRLALRSERPSRPSRAAAPRPETSSRTTRPRETRHRETRHRETRRRDTRRRAMRAGGAALVLAAVAFVSVFLFLAATFDYPAVLDRPAAVVLPRLVALGATGRAAWAGYALLPLLLVPGAVGVATALGRGAAAPMRVAQLAASLSAFAMTLGLARWSTVHWTLAVAWERMPADAGARAALAAIFDGLNALLGTFIGEFVGELGLYGFLLLTAAALAPHGSRGVGAGARWRGATRSLAALLAVTAAAGLVAMFRNVTAAPPREVASVATLVDGAAALSNLLLPLALAALGAWLLTVPVRGPGAAARGAGARHG